MDRRKLRQQVWRQHLQYISEVHTVGVLCPWCGKQVEDSWHLHEWLVKRSAVPVDKQYLIMVAANCVPVHPNNECHNQSKEMTRRCLAHIVPRIHRADQVGGWYTSLWQEYGLSLPRGLLLPQKDIPMAIAYRLFKHGAAVLNMADWEVQGGQDVAALAILKWRGKKIKKPKSWGKYGLGSLIEAVNTGYWLEYLENIIG